MTILSDSGTWRATPSDRRLRATAVGLIQWPLAPMEIALSQVVDDKTLRLWDLAGNAIGSPFEGHSGSVRSVAFSPDGDRIVSGSDDETLRLWDLAGNAIGSPFEGHSGAVNSVAFSPDGDRIVSGSHDYTLRLWDLAGNAIGSPFEGHSGSG